MPMAKAGGLSLVCGLAVSRTLAESGVSGVTLKWPNDILIHREGGLYKLAGILVELTGRHCVVGIGLNIDMDIDTHINDNKAHGGGIESPTTDTAIPWTDLACQGHHIQYSDFVARLIINIFAYLDRFKDHGFEAFAHDWDNNHYFHGKDVVISGGSIEHGTVVGVDARGALKLQTGQGQSLIYSGDVSMRAADYRDNLN